MKFSDGSSSSSLSPSQIRGICSLFFLTIVSLLQSVNFPYVFKAAFGKFPNTCTPPSYAFEGFRPLQGLLICIWKSSSPRSPFSISLSSSSSSDPFTLLNWEPTPRSRKARPELGEKASSSFYEVRLLENRVTASELHIVDTWDVRSFLLLASPKLTLMEILELRLGVELSS